MKANTLRYTEVVIATLQAPIDDWYVAALLGIPEKHVVYHRREVYDLKTTAQPLTLDILTKKQREYADQRAYKARKLRSVEFEYPTDPEWYAKRTLLNIAADLVVTPYDAFRHVMKHRYPYKAINPFTKYQYPKDPDYYATRTLTEMSDELRIPKQALRQHMKVKGYTCKTT